MPFLRILACSPRSPAYRKPLFSPILTPPPVAGLSVILSACGQQEGTSARDIPGLAEERRAIGESSRMTLLFRKPA